MPARGSIALLSLQIKIEYQATNLLKKETVICTISFAQTRK